MIRRAGFALAGIGALVVVWAGVTVIWGDPVTSLYTRYEQHRLTARLGQVDRHWDHVQPSRALVVQTTPTSAAERRRQMAARIKARAIAFRNSLHDGDPIGRIVVPSLHLRMVVVQGTTEADLQKAPGHYDAASGQNTGVPGMGGVIGIAGHRTTFLHPFRHIDDLRPGQRIYLAMPYGTFRYVVYAHRIVTSSD